MNSRILRGILVTVLLLSLAGQAAAGAVILKVPDYHWWYGCSPTSVGMIMGWYDRNGYDGCVYPDLIPGGTAGFSTHVRDWDGLNYEWAANGDTLASKTIASSGHIEDFYQEGYLASGDDQYTGRPFDCLADFMGTSQDSDGRKNGATDMEDTEIGRAHV